MVLDTLMHVSFRVSVEAIPLRQVYTTFCPHQKLAVTKIDKLFWLADSHPRSPASLDPTSLFNIPCEYKAHIMSSRDSRCLFLKI